MLVISMLGIEGGLGVESQALLLVGLGLDVLPPVVVFQKSLCGKGSPFALS